MGSPFASVPTTSVKEHSLIRSSKLHATGTSISTYGWKGVNDFKEQTKQKKQGRHIEKLYGYDFSNFDIPCRTIWGHS